MCGTSASADRLLVVHEARVAADELVERFLRLPVAKAMNLGTRAGFDRAVALLAAQLRVITNPTGAPNPIRKGPLQELLETKGSIRTGPPREVDVCNKENWPG